MQVIYLDGKPMTVTDLAKAIKQASMFMDFRHVAPTFAQVDKRLHEYWRDLHDKLVALQKEQTAQPKHNDTASKTAGE